MHDIHVFYAEYFTVELWGQDLYAYLDTVYRERSRFTVVFISKSYVTKPWPSHERQSAQARALSELGPYLLPVRFDDSILPGLRPTVAYIDASQFTPEQLARLIIDKLADAPGIVSAQPTGIGVPRTTEEQRQLLSQRPDLWEYLFYASVLLMRRANIEEKWRDHEIGYARRTGRYLKDRDAIGHITNATGVARGILDNFNRVLDLDAQEAAFGAPGEPGNPEKIEHLATRLVDVYEELLDWARNLRGISVSNNFSNLFELTAHLADGPARQIRDFVDDFVAQAERLPDLLNRDDDEPIHINMILKLEIDDGLQTAIGREFDRVEKILSSGEE